MARDWEQDFRRWAEGPSKTEQQKAENAESMIRSAIAASSQLRSRAIEVFGQGSYRNRTNVRQDSDVDVCVRCMDSFFGDYSKVSREQAGVVDATYRYADFRNDVEAALRSSFGTKSVTRGNKAFDIHENTYRVDADVVACFEHRRYYTSNGAIRYLSGTELVADDGTHVRNWPHQQYDNGVQKNDETGRRFKRLVRILKRLRNEMAENGNQHADNIPSYLIECLVWNVPNDGFGHTTYGDDLRFVLATLWNKTRTAETCAEWGEENELKYLFCGSQKWTREQSNSFLQAAWDYLGYQ